MDMCLILKCVKVKFEYECSGNQNKSILLKILKKLFLIKKNDLSLNNLNLKYTMPHIIIFFALHLSVYFKVAFQIEMKISKIFLTDLMKM